MWNFWKSKCKIFEGPLWESVAGRGLLIPAIDIKKKNCTQCVEEGRQLYTVCDQILARPAHITYIPSPPWVAVRSWTINPVQGLALCSSRAKQLEHSQDF